MSRRPVIGFIGVLLLSACSFLPATTPSPGVDANADPELAARIPASVRGEPLVVETFRDPDTIRLAGVNAEFLETLGVEAEAVSVATAHRPMATATSAHLSMFAYRVLGVREDALAEYFVPIMEGQSEDRTFEATVIGGKPVWAAVDPGAGAVANTVYVKDDTAYLIYSDRPRMVEELIAALP